MFVCEDRRLQGGGAERQEKEEGEALDASGWGRRPYGCSRCCRGSQLRAAVWCAGVGQCTRKCRKAVKKDLVVYPDQKGCSRGVRRSSSVPDLPLTPLLGMMRVWVLWPGATDASVATVLVQSARLHCRGSSDCDSGFTLCLWFVVPSSCTRG